MNGKKKKQPKIIEQVWCSCGWGRWYEASFFCEYAMVPFSYVERSMCDQIQRERVSGGHQRTPSQSLYKLEN